jgi:syntaxin 16
LASPNYLTHVTAKPELQGHAIKNQDLLIASGAISLKGSDGMTAVEEDVEAVSAPHHAYSQHLLICL